MMIASALSTIEAAIPYLILVGVIVFIVWRLVGVSLIDLLLQARKRKSKKEHIE